MSISDRAKGLPRIQRYVISAFFESPYAVGRVLADLNAAGLPRDRVEVAVTPAAADQFYGGRSQGRWSSREAFRYAGIGGITGLVIGAAVSLLLVALPGFQEPGVMAWVQLLGPNFATISGAVIGAGIGWFQKRPPAPWHVRLREQENGVLVAAITRSKDEAPLLAEILQASGGAAVRTDPR